MSEAEYEREPDQKPSDDNWRRLTVNGYLLEPEANLDEADLHEERFMRANLCAASLRRADLRGAKIGSTFLIRADGTESDWSGSHLQFCPAFHIDLSHSKWMRAQIQGGFWTAAKFDGANLDQARIGRARMPDASFKAALLTQSSFKTCDLRGCDFTNAVASHARFEGCDLRGANFSDAEITGASFSGADLRGAIGLVFSEHDLSDVKLAPDAPDPWSVLRRNYTGAMAMLSILLSAIALAPYIARTVFAEIMPGQVDELRLSLLLGYDRGSWIAASSTVIVLYNVLLIGGVQYLARLREGEDRTGMVPKLVCYRWAYGVHRRFMYPAMWLTRSLAIVRTGQWLLSSV